MSEHIDAARARNAGGIHPRHFLPPVEFAEKMRAFDALPPSVRRVLREAWFNFRPDAVAALVQAWGARETVEYIRRYQRKLASEAAA